MATRPLEEDLHLSPSDKEKYSNKSEESVMQDVCARTRVDHNVIFVNSNGDVSSHSAYLLYCASKGVRVFLRKQIRLILLQSAFSILYT